MNELVEDKESLWRLTVAPSAWAAHFMLSYTTAAIWCEKFAVRHGSLAPARALIGVYTVLALAVIVYAGWRGWKRHRLPGGRVPHDDDTPADRHRFLGYATFLLALLSAVATVYGGLVVVFLEDCR